MKITEQVHQIRIDFQVTEKVNRFVYIYLITGESCYLIDSGVAGSEKIIEEYMQSIGREITEIKGVFLTHAHPDHMGSGGSADNYQSEKKHSNTESDCCIEWRDLLPCMGSRVR